MLGRRVDSEDPLSEERQALLDQRTALEDLKRQLAERVAAVSERESELRAAMAAIASGKEAGIALPPLGDPQADRLAARAAVLAERERAVAAREAAAAFGAANGSTDQALAAREAALRERESALATREDELDVREREFPVDPDAARLAQIEARLGQLRAAEEAFLRTRRDLADHSDAITAREQLLAQRERDLDEREDGWGGPELRDLESRLRRLESQRVAGGQTGSFSGGFRKLEQEGTRKPQE